MRLIPSPPDLELRAHDRSRRVNIQLTEMTVVDRGLFRLIVEIRPNRSHFAREQIFRVLSNHLKLKRPTENEAWTYNVLQRVTYLGVVFILLPMIIWTGLGMSPSVTSVFPILATALGGQQSARTVHFFLANLLVLFFIIHLAMVCLAGFSDRVRAMLTGRVTSQRRNI